MASQRPTSRRGDTAAQGGPARRRAARRHPESHPLERLDPTWPAEQSGPAGYGAPDRREWRSTIIIASGLNVLAGIWLIIAPFVLGYGSGDPYWNDIVFGAIVAVLALARISGAYRATWMSWLNMAIGIWVFLAAFWLDDTTTAATNDVILGAVVFLLALASASASDDAATAGAARLPRS